MGLPSLPLTWWAEEIGGSTDLSDYQIAHLPPSAASVGAARWAAQFFNIGRTRYFRAGRGSGSGERTAGDPVYGDVQRFGFRGVRGDGFRRGQARGKS